MVSVVLLLGDVDGPVAVGVDLYDVESRKCNVDRLRFVHSAADARACPSHQGRRLVSVGVGEHGEELALSVVSEVEDDLASFEPELGGRR